MTNMKCPKCGFEQEEAAECIRCGIVFAKFKDSEPPIQPKPSSSSPPPKAPDKETKRLRVGIVTVAAMCVFSFFAGMVSMQAMTDSLEKDKQPVQVKPVKVTKKTKTINPKPEKKKRAIRKTDWREREDTSMAYIMMEDFVKNRLKAPKTAEFPSVWSGRDKHVTYLGNQRYRIASYVDAQNSFGALIRNHFVGEIEQKSKDRWSLVSFNFIER